MKKKNCTCKTCPWQGKKIPANTLYFKPNKDSKDKLASWCRLCTREDSRRWRRQNKKKVSLANAKYRRKYPDRIRCYRLFSKMIRRPLRKFGIEKNIRCQVTGCKEYARHFHHVNYKFAFYGTWVCPKHHRYQDLGKIDLALFAQDYSVLLDKINYLTKKGS